MNKYILAQTTTDAKEQLSLIKEDLDTRYYLALNPALDIDVQLLLVKDNDAAIRQSLALNLALDENVQCLLAKDNDVDVQQNLAWNPSITDDVQILLADYFYSFIKNPGPKTKKYLEMKKVLDK